jgi:choline-sulfatase
MTDRPGIYRKAARLWKDRTDRERREAAACYYAAITEVDDLFGRLIDQVQTASRLDETVVVFTADHGELLGAHGLYCKNFSAFEEVYHIPMVLAGPGVAAGVVTDARVGLHDLAPTLLDLTEAGTLGAPDSRSFAAALRDPAGRAGDFTAGFAEYHGTRYRLTQRVVWEGPWKYVFNGFDNDELYRLDEDPFEMRNLAVDAASAPVLRRMAARMWRVMHDTGDRALLGSHYPILRVAPFGPGIADEDGRASV